LGLFKKKAHLRANLFVEQGLGAKK